MKEIDEQEMQWEDSILCISGSMGSDYEYCIVRNMTPELLSEKVHDYVRLEETGEIQPEEQSMEEYLEEQGATVIPVYASNGLGEDKPVRFFDVEYDVDTGIRLFSDLNIQEKIEMLMGKMEYIGTGLNEEEKKWIKDYAVKAGDVTGAKDLIEKILMEDSTENIRDRVLAMEESNVLSGQEAYYAIYQINEDTKGKGYRFMGMDYVLSHSMRIDASDYNYIYSDRLTEGDTLDRLYERFNIDHPEDYTGHSLSVSDVIVLQEEQRMKAYYVDSFGYRELPDFLRQRQEMLNTDDLITNQTRGIAVEGHFGTWHTVEAKEIAGETFFRMEHDEYGDSVAGIIVNTDGKLVAEDLEHGFDAGAMEAITEYLYEKVPAPFIKQFYVVNDAYGIKAEREYQYFENLDDAIQAYHLLPNHLDKRLGMESREPVTSRMTLLKCENGIENVEDVKQASLDGKWVNDEVADAYNRAQFYLDNRDTNIVYELPSKKGYFYIQTTAEGWFDYTFYDRKYRELDGGSYENTDISIQEAVEALLNEEKIMLAQCHVICWNDFMEAVTEAGQREIRGKIEMPLTSGITEKEKALGGMSRSAIEETVLCYAQAQLEDMGLADEVKLNAARVYGSRTRAGLYNNGSDLDVVLFYTGNIREDDFFSALHKAGMAIAGIPLDITPVSENRTCTMEEYMKNAEKYLDDKELKKLAYDIDQFLNEFDLYEYRDTVEDREENVEMIYADLVSGEAESIRKWVAEIAEGENDDLPEDVESAKKLLTRIGQAQETGRAEVVHEPKVAEAKITFYVAECMEFPVMGEYHDNLTLTEAFQKYKEIPPERMNGIKGIGFRLEDGSLYDGNYELMRAGVISKDMIDLVPHYKESPLVQKAVGDLEQMLSQDRQRENAEKPEQKEQEKAPDTEEKPMGVRQSVLAALRERQAKQKAQEEKKTEQKIEKITQGQKKGEAVL